jgi:hypothetical protein
MMTRQRRSKPNWILVIWILIKLAGKTQELAIFNRMEAALSVTEGCVIENLHTGNIGVSSSEQCRSHL